MCDHGQSRDCSNGNTGTTSGQEDRLGLLGDALEDRSPGRVHTQAEAEAATLETKPQAW